MNMSPNDTKSLTWKQRKALDALLTGAKVKDAALAAGVSDRTVKRWQIQKAFALDLQQRSTLATKDAARRLTTGLDDMLDVLMDVAQDEDATDHVRVRAANAWIGHQYRLVELGEVLERLDALEQVVR
jgi:FixJ family two-component response regulator